MAAHRTIKQAPVLTWKTSVTWADIKQTTDKLGKGQSANILCENRSSRWNQAAVGQESRTRHAFPSVNTVFGIIVRCRAVKSFSSLCSAHEQVLKIYIYIFRFFENGSAKIWGGLFSPVNSAALLERNAVFLRLIRAHNQTHWIGQFKSASRSFLKC